MMRRTVTVMTLMLDLQEDKTLDSKIRHALLVVPDNHLDSGGEHSVMFLLQLLWMGTKPTKRL